MSFYNSISDQYFTDNSKIYRYTSGYKYLLYMVAEYGKMRYSGTGRYIGLKHSSEYYCKDH